MTRAKLRTLSPTDRIIKQAGGGSQLARMLGVSPSAVSGYRSHGFPSHHATALTTLTGLPYDQLPLHVCAQHATKLLDAEVAERGGIALFAQWIDVSPRTVQRWRQYGLTREGRYKLALAGIFTFAEMKLPTQQRPVHSQRPEAVRRRRTLEYI